MVGAITQLVIVSVAVFDHFLDQLARRAQRILEFSALCALNLQFVAEFGDP
jgi:hypothetical protein